MKVLRPLFCGICGDPAQNFCSICGQPVCQKHLDPASGACARCAPKRGGERVFSDDAVLR